MKCKFCGCSDDKPCFIPKEFIDGAVAAVPCAWLTLNCCSAPACVDKAYAEAELLASQLQFFIERAS
jgi:hypothetical protein